MSDVVLVVLERPATAAHLLRAAECLAVRTGGARVNVLAIRTPPGYAALTAEATVSGDFLEALAAIASSRGEAERCALLLGAAEALLEEVGARVHNYYVPDPSLQERAVAEARAALGDATFEEARERGQAMTFDQAVEYALGADAARGDSGSQ